MNPKELREKIAAAKRAADELLKKVTERDGKMTSEEREAYDKHVEEMRALGETLDAVEAEEKRSLEFAANAPAVPNGGAGEGDEGRTAAPPTAEGGPLTAYGPFRNFGEFVHAVRFGNEKKLAEYRQVLAADLEKRALSMDVDGEGGYLVADKWSTNILMIDPEEEIVRPSATVIPAGSPPDAKEHFPALAQGALGVLGGLSFGWVATEGGPKPETDYDLVDVVLDPEEYAAHVVVTDKLLRNSQAAASFLQRMLNMGTSQHIDLALIDGDGTNKPKGFLQAACAIAVNRAVANKIDFADVVGMLAKLLPGSWGRARWVAHVSTLPELVSIEDANGNSVFIAGDAAAKIPPTLFGIPIKWTGRTKALGTKGDLALVDLTYYLVKMGSGPFIAASEHVHFTNNKTVVKAFGNIDGDMWPSAALELDDGASTASPVVILDIPGI